MMYFDSDKVGLRGCFSSKGKFDSLRIILCGLERVQLSLPTLESRRQQRPSIPLAGSSNGKCHNSQALVNPTELIEAESIKLEAALTLEEVQIMKKDCAVTIPG